MSGIWEVKSLSVLVFIPSQYPCSQACLLGPVRVVPVQLHSDLYERPSTVLQRGYQLWTLHVPLSHKPVCRVGFAVSLSSVVLMA